MFMFNRTAGRKIVLVTGLVAVAVSGAVIYFSWRPSAKPVPTAAPTMAPPRLPPPPGVYTPEVAKVSPATVDQRTLEPLATADAVPPLPAKPRVKISAANAQRLRRYEFDPDIGDVYRLAYHRPSGALFLATVERDGLRSIWRMEPDMSVRRVFGENYGTGDIFLAADSRGNLYAQFDDPGNVYRSSDGGEYWRPAAFGIAGTFWQIADDGQGTLWATQHAENTAVLYRSVDDGQSWAPWTDFHRLYPELAVTYANGDPRFKLRHLHAVSFVDEKLFVGVGDFVRFTVVSEDRGATWKQIWDEGFTAGVPLADGSGLLLGPDRLRSHGLAVYDFQKGQTKEVWSPMPYGYAGYTYSLLQVGGVYFAGFHTEANEVTGLSSKFGLVASPDLLNWFPYLELGPLSSAARTDIFLDAGPAERQVFMTLNGSLYDFTAMPPFEFDFYAPFGVRRVK